MANNYSLIDWWFSLVRFGLVRYSSPPPPPKCKIHKRKAKTSQNQQKQNKETQGKGKGSAFSLVFCSGGEEQREEGGGASTPKFAISFHFFSSPLLSLCVSFCCVCLSVCVCVCVCLFSLSLSLFWIFWILFQEFCARSFVSRFFVILLLLAAISDLHSCLSLSAAAA